MYKPKQDENITSSAEVIMVLEKNPHIYNKQKNSANAVMADWIQESQFLKNMTCLDRYRVPIHKCLTG